MPAKFSPAPEVERIAAPLIREHHAHLINNNVRVVYCFVDKAPNSGGKTRWGQARKVSGLNAFLFGLAAWLDEDADRDGPDDSEFFVMVISKDVWKWLRDPQKRALVDHELSHMWCEPDEKTGEVKLSILPHDLEEFGEIVRRHGAWQAEVEGFLRAAQAGPQLPLLPVEAA